MAPDLNPDGMDEAAADPPLGWLAVAVLGVLLVAAGLVATGLGLAGLADAVAAAVPLADLLVRHSLWAVLFGVALFVLAMTEWAPDLDT